MPHYLKLLEFINLQAQASEASISEHKRAPHNEDCARKVTATGKPIAAFTATAKNSAANGVMCKTEKHLLYACSKFKALPHKKNGLYAKNSQPLLELSQVGTFCEAVQVTPPLQDMSESTS